MLKYFVLSDIAVQWCYANSMQILHINGQIQIQSMCWFGLCLFAQIISIKQ